MIAGLAATLYYVFYDFKPTNDIKYIASAENLPKFFATVIFAIEGIGVVSLLL